MIELTAPQHIRKTRIKLSGSKSISNRLLVLNEISGLDLSLENLSDSEDTILLKNALQQIKGNNKATIDIHHAGTDMRFLTAFLAVTEGEWTLTGSDRMKQRPIGELVAALRSIGADIRYVEKEDFPPVLIRGKKLTGGNIEIDSSVSSQFVSALLLITPALEKGLSLTLKGNTVSWPYVNMTVSLLKNLGMRITQSHNKIIVEKSSALSHQSPIIIESDWSSASYWYSICALDGMAGIELSILHKNSLQADSVLPALYKNLGVKTTYKEGAIILKSIPPIAKNFDYDFTDCPDIAQTVALTCFGLGIKATLRGLSTLKIKETDRIHALKTELEKFGVSIVITDDTLRIDKYPSSVKRLTHNISTYNDHRMAMSFAPLALLIKQLHIDDPAVVRKSYGSFWEDLKSVGFNVNLQP